MIHLIAVLVSIAGILAVAGNGAYLALLGSVAKKKGAAGAPTEQYVRKQFPAVAAAGGAALLALLMTSGGAFMDIVAILVAAGAGTVALGHLGKTRDRYGKPELGA
ncbi:hypothetical protein EK0264_06745 [Epidermidibacterium keratini]|uniref:DUF3784 domain-containing protein n=1 Tax=Epidermidibacterium keratini TaxID=1891644 RepID=A0A7L4YME9_9ACTN|nr:hypothetical protein [Epidermidibacterium keratini]QHC00004.1 hypothetical protein EK0264_06745 [Epidermidibacterium keratini]